MNWLSEKSFRAKLRLGSYSFIIVISLLMLFASLFELPPLITIIIIVVIIGVTYPLINLFEKTLTEPIDAISRIATNISKGDFSQKVRVTSDDTMGELGNSFNKMMDKLKDILTETGGITRHVSDSSRQ